MKTLSKKTINNTQKQLTELIQASHSPFHCCEYCAEELTKNGFQELLLNKPFDIKAGGKYYVKIFGGSLIAFTIGKKITSKKTPVIRMITSHTDWPSFVVKPNPDIKTDNYVRLNTEPYGGAVYHTWIDRPLGLAGKVCIQTEDAFHPELCLYDSTSPILIIPGLAVHMDRDINSGLKLNPQTQLLPLCMLASANKDEDFLTYLSEQLHCNKDAILDYELFVYNHDNCETVGIHNELFSAPRIDNCSSVLCGLEAICNTDPHDNLICISAFYHNEEIGNQTKQGAASNITNQILERVYDKLGLDKETLYCSLADGICLSLDVAHALHPAYTEKNDITNKVCLGDGVCLKLSARQSYSTDSSYIGVIQGLCEKYDIPYGKFVNRSDQRGGSTLGTVASAALNIPCVDAGVPLLSMHSARELIALNDQAALCELAKKLFS